MSCADWIAPITLGQENNMEISLSKMPSGRSFAARGGKKDWPNEWVCRNCAWAKGSKVTLEPVKPGQKMVWCQHAAQRWMWHNSDRACYEEPLELLLERRGFQDES